MTYTPYNGPDYSSPDHDRYYLNLLKQVDKKKKPEKTKPKPKE